MLGLSNVNTIAFEALRGGISELKQRDLHIEDWVSFDYFKLLWLSWVLRVGTKHGCLRSEELNRRNQELTAAANMRFTAPGYALFWILLTLNVGASNGIHPGKIDPFACFSRLPPAVVLEPLQVVGTVWFCVIADTCKASQGWLWAAFALEASGTTESRSYVPGFIDVHH